MGIKRKNRMRFSLLAMALAATGAVRVGSNPEEAYRTCPEWEQDSEWQKEAFFIKNKTRVYNEHRTSGNDSCAEDKGFRVDFDELEELATNLGQRVLRNFLYKNPQVRCAIEDAEDQSIVTDRQRMLELYAAKLDVEFDCNYKDG